jgi:transcription elongation factor Elf1
MELPKFTFDMECPVCKRQDMIEVDKKSPPPKLHCGDCLMLEMKMVELTIVRVLVGVNS